LVHERTDHPLEVIFIEATLSEQLLSANRGTVTNALVPLRAIARLAAILLRWTVLAGVVAFAVLAAPAFAQQATGSIYGAIADSTGAVIPQATVTITNQTTLKSVTLTADGTGKYRSPPIDAGLYTIEIEKSGYRPEAQKNFDLGNDQQAEINFQLRNGSVSETIDVEASTPSLNTFNATLGSVIDNATAEALPLNGSNALALAQLDPSVVSANGPVNEGFNDRGLGVSNIRIGGGLSGANANLLDGAYNLQTTRGEVLINSTVTGIAESRVQYGAISSQFGLTSGGVVTMTTLSGTNNYHGQLYEFFRNSALNAANHFAPKGTKPALRYNQYGASLGGPIKRDKAFFFANYEAYRNTQVTPTSITVPTQVERGGDYSDQSLPIYDPTSQTACTANSTNGACRYQYGYTGGASKGLAGNPILSGAPVNVVPSNQFDAAAIAFQAAFVPLPNVAGTLVNNYVSNLPLISSQQVSIGRIDWQVRNNLSAFARYAYYDNLTNNEGSYGSLALTASTRNDLMRNQNLTIGITQVLSGNKLNDIRIAVGRSYFPYSAGSSGGNWPTQLGIANLNGSTLPYLSVAGYGMGDSTNQGVRTSTIPEINDTVTWLHGLHSLHFGVGYRFYQSGNNTNYYSSGEFSFAASLTAQVGPSAESCPIQQACCTMTPVPPGCVQIQIPTGNSYASFLTGKASSITATVSAPSVAESYSVNGFIQDDWRALPNLTLNLGMRYDYQAIPWEKANGFSTLRTNLINPVNGLQGEEIYASAHDRNFANENYLDFGPRVGFAWLVSQAHHVVLRGGYAVYYAPAFNVVYTNTNDGFGSLTTTFPANSTNGFVGLLSGGFPSAPLGLVGTSGGPSLLLGQSPTVQPVKAQTSMAQEFALSLDHQFAKNTVINVSLLENHGIHFPMTSINLNQLNPLYYSLGFAQLTLLTTNPYYADNIPGTLGGKTIQELQALKPYPYFQNLYEYYPHIGSYMSRNAQVVVRRPIFTSFQMQLGYSFGKVLADPLQTSISAAPTPTAVLQNNYAPHSEYGLDATDVTHRISGNLTYKLPFGKGQQFFGHVSDSLDRVIGGFTLASTLIGETGRPLQITGANGYGATRPDFVPGVSLKLANPGTSPWFNTAAFQAAPLYTLGNVPRTLGVVRTPGDLTLNLNLGKQMKYERYTGELRIDAFNALNKTNLGTPNTNYVASSTPTTSTTSTFGTITSAQPARTLQITARIRF